MTTTTPVLAPVAPTEERTLTRAERPGLPSPLRSARPGPDVPRDASASPASRGPGLVSRLLWRVGGLAALAVLVQLLA